MAFADNTVLFENLGLPSPLGKTRDLVPEGFRGCPPHPCDEAMPDLKDIKGQETTMRSLEVAAASGHHLLLIGPPGAGKSMLARRLPSILPPLEPAEMLEMLEVSMIKSLASDLAGGRISRTRPFRAPHHSASMAALVGDGTRPTPGEAALAHLGVLFLDELPEFNPNTNAPFTALLADRGAVEAGAARLLARLAQHHKKARAPGAACRCSLSSSAIRKRHAHEIEVEALRAKAWNVAALGGIDDDHGTDRPPKPSMRRKIARR